MKLRAPSVPLIAIDPYFSVWSPANNLNDCDTVHWTSRASESGHPCPENDDALRKMVMEGIIEIDGKSLRFMGADESVSPMRQVELDISAFTSKYVFEGEGVRLTAAFTSPTLITDLYYMTRPVSYLSLCAESIDGAKHKTAFSVSVSEQICLNAAGEDEIVTEKLTIGGKQSVKMGAKNQKVLWRDGDDLRIDWGYFYLTSDHGCGEVAEKNGMTYVGIKGDFEGSALITFAYDDIRSIKYFGKELPSYWNKDGETITEAIEKAFGDYKDILARCESFSRELYLDSVKAGGEKYAEILLLSYRQAIAAHKVAMRGDELVFISKECFSNGCAATVDVSYPSIPLFLIYNPELVRGMMRPIYEFARSDQWGFDFAPHDVGTYPIVYRQRYALTDWSDRDSAYLFEKQMPVEECGNMLIMELTTAIASGDFSFASSHRDQLDMWVRYLIENGRDPENQLCTDDFAGHLAHNCNLSLKAIMGIAAYGLILKNTGEETEGEGYIEKAREMANDWLSRASNGDGTYRLAFDKQGSFSMKYNIVWDKLLGTNIMPRGALESEISGYKKQLRPYGLPLDNRSEYTKSDWLLWTATLCERDEDFRLFAETLWNAYNFMPNRVPLTDWYFTNTSIMRGFQHRSVVGGHFIKLLEYKGILKL